MNTKGIKFLAVLAVMVMAFAAVIALAPADKDTSAEVVYGVNNVIVDPVVIYGNEVIPDTHTPITYFYITDDITVKIKGDLQNSITFFVQNGAELEIDIKAEQSGSETITIITVTADQQRPTTSTVDTDRGFNGPVDGKIKINDTELTFVAEEKQNVVYKALVPGTVSTYTTSGGFATEVTTGTSAYAEVSASEILNASVIGKKITVAAGQYIQTTTEKSDFGYGIKVIATETGATSPSYTYYGLKANAGAVTLTKVDTDKVEIISGTVTVSSGTASVKATSVTSGVTIACTGDNENTVSGVMETGTMIISGAVKFSDFTTYATVTLNANADVKSGTITVDGELYLKNDAAKIENLTVAGNGVVIAQNEKLWSYDGTTASLDFDDDDDFTGQYNVYAITKVAEVKDAFSTAEIKNNQTFVVVSDTVVTTQLLVRGTLIINEGVTLTITKTQKIGADLTLDGVYAQIINYGQILIQGTADASNLPSSLQSTEIGLHIIGGTAVNYGKIVASSDSNIPKVQATATKATLCVNFASDETKGNGLVNYGTISASKNDVVSFDKHFVNYGSVSVGGLFTGNGLVNGGTFTLNGASIGALTVNMYKGATFTIVGADIEANKTLTVNNSKGNGFISYKAPDTLGASEKCSIRNITITDVSTSKKGILDLSGNATASVPSGKFVTMETKGNVTVSSSASINAGYKLNFKNYDTNLTVSGDLTFAKDVALVAETDASKVRMVVEGLVTCVDTDKLSGVVYSGARFETSNAVIYAPLETAVPAAALADVNMIDVSHLPAVPASKLAAVYPTITSDLTIPEGMMVVGTSETLLYIDDLATVTVEADAMLSFDGIIVVDGMLVAADGNNVNVDTVAADVKETYDESNAVACMSLDVALAIATPGKVIALSQDFFMEDTTLVIPEGVTVDATAAEEATDFVLVNSNLVVNGTLVVDEFAFIATTDDTIGITVNGYIYDSCANGKCFNGWWYTPFGVSYFWTDDEDQTWYVLTTIENIQPAINEADDAKVSVEGDAVLDELTVSGRDDMPAEVTFKGDVDIGVINIDEVTLIFKDGNMVDTTVKNSVGSITITGAYVDRSLSIYDMAIYSSEVEGVYMEGSVTDNALGTYGILFEGLTGMDATDTRTAINYGNYAEVPTVPVVIDTPTIVFDGVTTVIGKKAYINYGEAYPNAMATITGTVYVDNASKLTVNSDVQVLGALVAAERSEDGVAGAVEMNGDLFVGTLKSDIYSFKDAGEASHEETEDYYGMALGDAAIVSGKIELYKADYFTLDEKPVFITVMPGSIVDPAIIEDLSYVDVRIDGDVWLTVYGYGDLPYSLDGLKAPIYNAFAYVGYDAYDVDCGDFNNLYKVVYDSPEKVMDLYGGFVNFALDYEVYAVKIKTDGSVKAVYIDGILMETADVANIFMIYKQAAGTHKVNVEAATGYDADKCVLYTEMGTILPGMAFTFTEYDCTEYDVDPITEELIPVVVYNINGTEIQPEPVPPTPEEESQWTITTILLVILVVLIAIMAVIVALRLNRS